MKHRTIIFVLFLNFLFPAFSSLAQGPKDEWYPFDFPERLDPNSPLNIGKLVLDAPAGKHGFVKVKDGHFYFEDGTRAKFWGTNLCFNANFPDKKQAEMLADRLAFFGFNAVRLHHMDYYFEPKGIFKDIAPAYKNPQSKETGHLSEKQLDRLDYLIYQLKLRGIYVDMNLLVSRHFTEADEIIDPGQLDMAGKPASLFDPKLIVLQKKYAEDLLTHKNPYTGLSYNNDPVIALVEIANENSLFAWWQANKLNGAIGGLKKDSIPNYYGQYLDKLWQTWLMIKYGSDKEISKIWKSASPPRPLYKFLAMLSSNQQENIVSFYTDIEKMYFEEMMIFLKDICLVKIPITGIGGCFSKEEVKAQKTCDFIDTHDYWDHPYFPPGEGGYHNFSIKNTSLFLKKYFENSRNILSDKKRNLYDDSLKPFTITEWNHCYPNQYAYETPMLLASKAHNEDWDGLFQFAFSHGWEFEPRFNNIQNYFDIIANGQQLVLNSVASRLYLSSEPPTLMMEKNHYLVITPSVTAAAGFIKGKKITLGPFTFMPSDNGAVILVSKDNKPLDRSKEFLLIAVGEIKNKNSGWNKSGKFNWGQGPVMIKRIRLEGLAHQFGLPLTITEDQNRPWQVIRLP